MRLAVDARSLSGERTGVGRTLEGLYGAWVRLYPGDSVVFLSPRPVTLPPALEGRVEVRPPALRLPGTLWLQASAPLEAAAAGADLFHGPLGVLPLAVPMPAVATIHDLTPLLFPEWHDRKNVAGFAPLLPATVRRAARLVCVSRATRDDLLRACPEADGKAVVVPNGLVPPGAAEAAPAPWPRPYVLTLGTIEPRKNHARLVRAMESIWDRRPGFPDLVLAGGSGWGMPGFAEALSRSRHAARIFPLGWVAAGRATALLRGARLLAYPSLYEGFGLPALEAMAEGIPVVASSSSSLPEVVGDAGLLPDPLDVAAIAAALERAHDDEAFRAAAARRGRERAALFTWNEAARATRALFAASLDEARA